MTPVEILALAALLAWAGLSLDRPRRWPGELRLPPSAEATQADGQPSVAALVPARDEALALPETLPALLAQEVEGFRIYLVDDGSSDGTAELARQLAEEAGCPERLEVLDAGPPEAGWSGKVHALAVGVEALERAGEAAPEWLLLTDADIRHRPGSVAALLEQARRGPYDLVSIMARLRAESFWERLLVPAFVFFFQLLYPFRRVADPRSRVAAAAGGCILVRKEALAAAGGLAAIRGAVIDDVALARQVQDTGGRLWLGLDAEIVSVRPYASLGEIWRMVARSAFVQLGYRWDLLAATLAALAIFLVSPPWIALGSLAGYFSANGHDAGDLSLLRAALWAALAWALQALALRPAVRHHNVPGRWAWALPFAGIFYGLMTLDSAWSHLRGRGSRWKGRSYRRPAANPGACEEGGEPT